jgi:hypothetical protein
MKNIKVKTPLRYGFFNCAEGTTDRTYSAEDFTGYLSSMICNGVLDTWGDSFSMTCNEAQLTIGSGYAWIDGHYAIMDKPLTLDLSQYADKNLGRWLTIGISCDTSVNVRDCSVEVLQGLAGSYSNSPTGWQAYADYWGVPNSTYPDVNGDGTVNAADVALILSFVASSGAGKYQNDANGWNAFTTDYDIVDTDYPDVDGDGTVTSADVAMIQSFITDVGAGGSSEKPEFEDTESKNYLTLAYVKIDSEGKILILQDVREDQTKCGYVKCILGKCKVSEISDAVSDLTNRVAALEESIAINPIGITTPILTGVTGDVGIIGNAEEEP